MKSNSARFLFVLCLVALGAAACGDDSSPTTPTPVEPPVAPPPEPEPVTISGEWHGEFEGALVAGEAFATLEQNGMDVTGNWSAPMPEPLVALGAPAGIELAGPVTGTVDGSTADLEFAFLEAFHLYFGGPDCVLDVHVTSFTEDELEGTWHTVEACPENVSDEGTLDMHKD